MSSRFAKLLTRIYPRSWRKRYGAEFEELLETGHGGLRTLADVASSGLRERIFAIRERTPYHSEDAGRIQSLCARAPWAAFTLAPVSLLSGCYLAACLILWIGWRVFLPSSDTPFGGEPQQGWANVYFQFGKYLYGGAPILVGWVTAVVAGRQRTKAVWPLTSFVLMAWIGAAAKIRASRTEIPGGARHIRITFDLWPWAPIGHDSGVHALVILSLALLPYLLWRRVHSSRTTIS